MKKVSIKVNIRIQVEDPADQEEVMQAIREQLESLASETDDDLAEFLDWEAPEEEEEESEI